MSGLWINRTVRRERAPSHGRMSRKRTGRQLLLQNLENRNLLAGDVVSLESTPIDSHAPDAQITPHPAGAVANVGFSMNTSVPMSAGSSASHHGASDAGHVSHPDDPAQAREHTAALALVDVADATHTVVASGRWSDPSIWSDAVVPTDGARIVIPSNLSLTIDGVIPQTFQTIRIDGTLRFDPSLTTELRVDTIVSAPGSTFEMGTAAQPIHEDVTARVVIADTGPIDRNWDPHALSRGLVLHGTSVMNGAAKNGWSALTEPPRAGDTSILLAESPDGWRFGDSLVIAGTQSDATGDEVVRITSIEGNRVSLDRALLFDHTPPAADLSVHVANTTRNAVIESENTAVDRRGHVMLMHSRDVQIDSAGFYELGRTNKLETNNDVQLQADGTLVPGTGTNPRGRYSVHFHRNGVKKDTPPATVSGSAVVGSPGWGYVNHSSYVDFKDNVSYDVDGAAFNTEVGDEVGSFVGNLSIKTHGTGGEPFEDGDRQDYGRSGDGFWFHGSGIAVEGNVASGATGSGIIFWGETLVVGKDAEGNPPPGGQVAEYLVENLPDPSLIPNHESIPTLYVPFHGVSNNQVYASGKGFEVYHHGDGELSENQNERFAIEDGNLDNNPFNLPDSVIDGITVWNSQTGVKLSYTENIQVNNVRIVNEFGPNAGIGFDAGTNLYNGGHHTYRDLSIEGYETGLLAPRGETVVIDGGRFANQTDIAIPELRQTHRRMDIRGDVQFADLPDHASPETIAGRQTIAMRSDLRNIVDGNVTWFLLSDRVTLNYGDFRGQQLFDPRQQGENVLFTAQPEQANPEDPGFAVPERFIGVTNAQLQSDYMTSFGGNLPSPDAIDLPDDQIFGLIGTPVGDPGLPPKPADIDVSVVDDVSVDEEEGEEPSDPSDDDHPGDEQAETEEDDPDDDEPHDCESEDDDEVVGDSAEDSEEYEDEESDGEEEAEENEPEDMGDDIDGEGDDGEEEADSELEDDEVAGDGENGDGEDDETEGDDREEDINEDSLEDCDSDHDPDHVTEDDVDAEDQASKEQDPTDDSDQAIRRFQNPRLATDVNDDQQTSVRDALMVINELNRGGKLGDRSTGSPVVFVFLDVNGDGSLSSLDALRIINALSQSANRRTTEGEAETKSSSLEESVPRLGLQDRLTDLAIEQEDWSVPVEGDFLF